MNIDKILWNDGSDGQPIGMIYKDRQPYIQIALDYFKEFGTTNIEFKEEWFENYTGSDTNKLAINVFWFTEDAMSRILRSWKLPANERNKSN